jgi:TP901 family phage tail tape measure protein
MDSLFNMAVILTAVDHFSGPMQRVARSMTAFDRMAERGHAWSRVGQQITVASALTQGAATVMQRGLMSVLQPAQDVEDALAMVATVVQPMEGTVGDALGRVKREALEWSKAHTDTADEFVRTTYMMISAGLDERAAIEATKTSLGVATATMGDNIEAANLLAVVYNNMADKTADAQAEISRIGDTLTKTQQTFQFANLNQLTTGMQYAIPVALQYGSSLEEVAVIMGGLNNRGLQGSMAGTAWAATMRNLNKASKDLGFEIAKTADGGTDFIATLANIEAKFGAIVDLSPVMQERFKAAFGDEGMRAISLLVGESQNLSQAMLDVANSAGTVETAIQKVEKTQRRSGTIIANNVNALKISLADNLAPTIESLTPKVIAVVDAIGGFAAANPQLMETGMIIAGIATAVLTVVAPALTVVGAIVTVGGAAVSAYGLIGASLVWLWPKILAATTATASLTATMVTLAVRSVPAAAAAMGRLAISMGGALLAGIRGATVAVRALSAAMIANPIGMLVAGIALGATLLITYWEPISGFFADLWSGVRSTFDTFSNWLTGWWPSMETSNGSAIERGLAVFWRFTPVGILTEAFDAAAKLLSSIDWAPYAVEIVRGLKTGFKSMIKDALAPVDEIATGIKDKFKSVLGIESPSKVFRGFGGDLVAGLALGISSSQAGAIARAASLAAGVAAAGSVAAPAVAAPVIAAAASATSPAIAAAAAAATPAIKPPVTAPPNAQEPATGSAAAPAVPGLVPHIAPLQTRGPRVADLPAPSASREDRAPRGADSGVSVTVNFNPTITIAAGDQQPTEASLRDALRDLGPDLARIVTQAVERAARTRF